MSHFPPPSSSPSPSPPVVVAPPQNSGMAVASLIFGILGLMTCALLGVVAIFLGNSAMSEIKASGGRIGGEGLAKAGIITGWVSVALMILGLLIAGVLFLLFAVFAVSTAATSP